MKQLNLRILAVAALSLALSMPGSLAQAKTKPKAKAKAKPAAAAPAQPLALSASASSSLKVLGDSTLHKWEAKATVMSISAQVEGGGKGVWEGAQSGLLKNLKLSLQVAGLKSNEGEKMDKNMRAAMEADKFGEISFVMSSYLIKDGEVVAKGALNIHGVSKDVELKGKITSKDKGVSVNGSFDLLMSEYGIKPPVMMLGTVRVADKVSIAYDFVLEDSAAAPGTAKP